MDYDYISNRKVIRVTHQPSVTPEEGAMQNFNLYSPTPSNVITTTGENSQIACGLTSIPSGSLPFVRLRPSVDEDRKIKNSRFVKQAYVPTVKFRNDVDSILNSPASRFVSEEKLFPPKQMAVLKTLASSAPESLIDVGQNSLRVLPSQLKKDNSIPNITIDTDNTSHNKVSSIIPISQPKEEKEPSQEIQLPTQSLDINLVVESGESCQRKHSNTSSLLPSLSEPSFGHFKGVFYPKVYNITTNGDDIMSPTALCSHIDGSSISANKLKVDPKSIIIPSPVSRWYPTEEYPMALAQKGIMSANSPLRPIIGPPLNLNIETSLFNPELSDRVSKKDKVIEDIASLFKQATPQSITLKSKKRVNGSPTSTIRPTSLSRSSEKTPKKKKKSIPFLVKPSSVTEVPPNIKLFFALLKRLMDETGKLNFVQFSNFLTEISGGTEQIDVILADNIFHKFESKHISPGFVQVGSCIAALNELLNGSLANKIADACFDVFNLDGRGYIHKAHLDQLRLMKTPVEGGDTAGIRTLSVHYEKYLQEMELNNKKDDCIIQEALLTPATATVNRLLTSTANNYNNSTIYSRTTSGGLLQGSTSSMSQMLDISTTSLIKEQTTNNNNNILAGGDGVWFSSNGPRKPHQVCTSNMVKVLGDIFIDMRKKEEEDYILKVFKKGKPKSKKKPPPLKPNQQSIIPTNMMRVSHINNTVFRKYMLEHKELAIAFAKRWILLIDQDEEVGKAVEDAVEKHEERCLQKVMEETNNGECE